MKTQHIVIYASIASLIGMLLFCFFNGLIIIQFAQPINYIENKWYKPKYTKTIRFIFWHNHRWCHETDTLVWPEDTQEALKKMLIRWLDIVHEEQLIPINVTLQSVLLSIDESIAYISFTANPLNQHAPTIDTILLIKGILRTISENKVPIQSIMFMENHAPLQDQHLDFAKPWPLNCLNHIPYNH